MSAGRDVLVTGATGYIGSRLVRELVARGHRVRGLVRPESLTRLPPDVTPCAGDALDAASVMQALRPGDCLVHLVGTPHPNPSKADEFRRVDLASITASVAAARRVGVAHIVYVSVAHPAPVMKDYIAVRTEGERLIADSGLTATVLRPWYVLGPGHRWPLLLVPLYAVAAFVPWWREGARRLGLVTVQQMVRGLVRAVEAPPSSGTLAIMDVPAIRASH